MKVIIFITAFTLAICSGVIVPTPPALPVPGPENPNSNSTLHPETSSNSSIEESLDHLEILLKSGNIKHSANCTLHGEVYSTVTVISSTKPDPSSKPTDSKFERETESKTVPISSLREKIEQISKEISVSNNKGTEILKENPDSSNLPTDGMKNATTENTSMTTSKVTRSAAVADWRVAAAASTTVEKKTEIIGKINPDLVKLVNHTDSLVMNKTTPAPAAEPVTPSPSSPVIMMMKRSAPETPSAQVVGTTLEITKSITKAPTKLNDTTTESAPTTSAPEKKMKRRKRSTSASGPIDISKLNREHVEITKEQFKASLFTDKFENRNSNRKRRSYGGSVRSSEVRSSGGSYGGSVRSSPMLYAVRNLPVTRSNYGRSLVREVPEIRSSGYDSDVRSADYDDVDVREISEVRSSEYGSRVRTLPAIRSSGYSRSLVREAPDVRDSGYGDSQVREAPEVRSSGYGRSLVREAPAVRSSGYGSSVRAAEFVEDVPSIRINFNSEVRDAPEEVRSLDYDSQVREEPDIRSSGYDSEVREVPVVRESPVVRSSGYGSSVRAVPAVRSSGYGSSVRAAEIVDVPSVRINFRSGEDEAPATRSSGYGSQVREVPATRSSGYGSQVREAPATRSSGYGSSVREVSATRSGYGSTVREVPATRSSGYGSQVREAPATRSSYASRIRSEEPPVRSTYDDGLRADEVDVRSVGGYVSDLSDLRESLDIPVVRSEYDVAPIRVATDTFEDVRDSGRYKRSTARLSDFDLGSSGLDLDQNIDFRKVGTVLSVPGKVTRVGSW